MNEGSMVTMFSPFQAIREEVGVSQKNLAQAVGVSHMTVMQTEKGLIKRPLAYARALKEAEIIEDAEAILDEHARWLQELQREKLQALKARV
jgi:DNA-binding XRE family transcriptional regulator